MAINIIYKRTQEKYLTIYRPRTSKFYSRLMPSTQDNNKLKKQKINKFLIN